MKPSERKLVGELSDDGHVDLPWESGSADPEGLAYSDELGPEKEYVEGRSFDKHQKRASHGEFGHRPHDPAAAHGEFAPTHQDPNADPAMPQVGIIQIPFDTADYLDRDGPIYGDPAALMTGEGEEV